MPPSTKDISDKDDVIDVILHQRRERNLTLENTNQDEFPRHLLTIVPIAAPIALATIPPIKAPIAVPGPGDTAVPAAAPPAAVAPTIANIVAHVPTATYVIVMVIAVFPFS